VSEIKVSEIKFNPADLILADGIEPEFITAPKIRPLRGRALLRLHPSELASERTENGIIIPGTGFNPRDKKIHKGTVLALGPPAYDGKRSTRESPWGCEVGDDVYFVYAVALEENRRFVDTVIVAQAELQAVVEP
jgi:co-chaperonin GroES (HSP10)